MSRSALVVLALLFSTAALAQPAAEPVAVVVAVDTSRSLSTGALAEVRSALGATLRALPAQTPTGLLAFDDDTRWVVDPGATPAAVAAALDGLEPRGRVTLLNDALFVAARALERGGVILLVTDGRDESSATTVEDIARRSEAQGVRILALGVGRAVEERALRRLALLTDGEYVGPIDRVDPATLARKLETARRALAAEASVGAKPVPPAVAPETSPPPPSPTAPPAAAPPAAPPTGAGGWAGGLLPLILALALLLTLTILTLVLARRSRAKTAPPTPESDDLELHARLAEREPAPSVEAQDVTVDTAVFHNVAEGVMLEKTRVLSGQGLIWMRRPGEEPRSFVLPREKAFAIGRDPESNTLAIPDPALSTHHFKIVYETGGHYLVDLHSTNGTFVNGERTLVRLLRNGDVIHAGQVEFDFRSLSGDKD